MARAAIVPRDDRPDLHQLCHQGPQRRAHDPRRAGASRFRVLDRGSGCRPRREFPELDRPGNPLVEGDAAGVLGERQQFRRDQKRAGAGRTEPADRHPGAGRRRDSGRGVRLRTGDAAMGRPVRGLGGGDPAPHASVANGGGDRASLKKRRRTAAARQFSLHLRRCRARIAAAAREAVCLRRRGGRGAGAGHGRGDMGPGAAAVSPGQFGIDPCADPR